MRTKPIVGLLLCLALVGCFKAPNNDNRVKPTSGLVVVIVEDETRAEPLTSGQVVAMGAGSVQEYLASHCAKGADGQTPESKKYKKGTDVSLQSPAVQKLHEKVVEKMDKSGSKDPHIGIQSGRKTAIGPVPEGEQNMLNLLKKYGG